MGAYSKKRLFHLEAALAMARTFGNTNSYLGFHSLICKPRTVILTPYQLRSHTNNADLDSRTTLWSPWGSSHAIFLSSKGITVVIYKCIIFLVNFLSMW